MRAREHHQKMVRVFACGERLRGDDAAALRAIQMLPADARALAEITEVGQLSVEVLLDTPDGVAVIVADAAVGVAPGAVVTLPLESLSRRDGAATPASSHSLSPDQVIDLATELRGTPLRGSFVGIGGSEFGFGEGLSPAVSAGLPAFTAALATEIRRLTAE
jgi:hydrogenase maturation protease